MKVRMTDDGVLGRDGAGGGGERWTGQGTMQEGKAKGLGVGLDVGGVRRR